MNSIFDGRSGGLRQSDRGSSGRQRTKQEIVAEAQREKLLRRQKRERVAAASKLVHASCRFLAVRQATRDLASALDGDQVPWTRNATQLMFVASNGRSLRRDQWSTLSFRSLDDESLQKLKRLFTHLRAIPKPNLSNGLPPRLLLLFLAAIEQDSTVEDDIDIYSLLLSIAARDDQSTVPFTAQLVNTIQALLANGRAKAASQLVETTLEEALSTRSTMLELGKLFTSLFSVAHLTREKTMPPPLVLSLFKELGNSKLDALDSATGPETVSILRNVLTMNLFTEDKAVSPPVHSVISVLSKLLVRIPTLRDGIEDSGTLNEVDSDSDASMDSDDFGRAPVNPDSLTKSHRSALARAMAPVFDSSVLRALLEGVLPAEHDEEEPITEENSNATSLATFFQLLSSSNRALEFKLVTLIAFGTARSSEPRKHLLQRLWRACRAPQAMASSDVPAQDLLLEPGSKSMGKRVPLLELFCKAYTQLLTVSDEDEIYEHQRVFSLDQMREISGALREALFLALYVPTNGSRKYLSIFDGNLQVAEAASRTLSRLRICDERRPFTDSSSFWFPNNSPLGSQKFTEDAAIFGFEAKQKGPKRKRPNQAGKKSLTTVEEQQESVTQILRLAPYFIPFRTRAAIFAEWVEQERGHQSEVNFFGGLTGRWITIRRPYLFEDAVSELADLKDGLKQRIRIKFEDEHGIEEVGIDGGGVFKEFMHEFMEKAFSSMYGLFKETEQGQVYPEPASDLSMPNHVELFQFLGRMLGKALSDGVTVKLQFAPFFINKILGRHNFLDDLKSLDKDLHKNLQYVRNCKDDEEVEGLGLNFAVVDNNYGEIRETELIPGGKDVSVVYSNRLEYVDRVANYRLNRQIKQQSEAFMRGLSGLVHIDWLRIFGERELQEMISGREGPIDLVDLQKNCTYSGGYTETSPTIRWLWKAVAEFSPADQSRLLRFVSSSPRAPLLGFRSLNPPFCIHRAESDGNTRLPSASTCMNLLKLPEYNSYDATRDKLLLAIQNHSGFGLS